MNDSFDIRIRRLIISHYFIAMKRGLGLRDGERVVMAFVE